MKGTMAKEVKAILNKPAKSKKPDGTPRKYGYLLDGRFAIERAAYVEKKDDSKDIIFGKALDFSGSTLSNLFEKRIVAGNKAYECSTLPQTTKTL
jgi:hypothetical protein